MRFVLCYIILMVPVLLLATGCQIPQSVVESPDLLKTLSSSGQQDSYFVIVNSESGKHVGVTKTFSALVQNETIKSMSGLIYESAGTAKPYDDVCHLVYASSDSPEYAPYIKVNCSVLDGYALDGSTNADIKTDLESRFKSILSDWNQNDYQDELAALVLSSKMRGRISADIDSNIQNNFMTLGDILNEGDCFSWHLKGTSGIYEACFENGMLSRYEVKSDIVGWQEDIYWKSYPQI